jgi:hypothetical protein
MQLVGPDDGAPVLVIWASSKLFITPVNALSLDVFWELFFNCSFAALNTRDLCNVAPKRRPMIGLCRVSRSCRDSSFELKLLPSKSFLIELILIDIGGDRVGGLTGKLRQATAIVDFIGVLKTARATCSKYVARSALLNAENLRNVL